MAFPTTYGARPQLARALIDSIATAAQIKTTASNLSARSSAGPIIGRDVIEFATQLTDAVELFDKVRTNPGIDAYAKKEFNDANLDIGAEFSAMRSAALGVRDWIVTQYPAGADRSLKVMQFSNGRFALTTLTTIEAEPLRTELDALVATID